MGAEKSQKMLSQSEPEGPGVGPTEEAMLGKGLSPSSDAKRLLCSCN